MGIGAGSSTDDILHGCVLVAVRNVLSDRQVEQNRLLANETELRANRVDVQLANVDTV